MVQEEEKITQGGNLENIFKKSYNSKELFTNFSFRKHKHTRKKTWMILIVIHLIKNFYAHPNDPTSMFILRAFSNYGLTKRNIRLEV